jgi:hypothetical protein
MLRTTLLLLALCCQLAHAADAPTTKPSPLIVRIERVKTAKKIQPAATSIPPDAMRLDSIETLALPNSDYQCVVTAQGVRTELSGHLTIAPDCDHTATYGRIDINYHRQLSDGNQQIKSNLMLKPGQTICMGFVGPPDGPGEALFLTLDTPAPKK